MDRVSRSNAAAGTPPWPLLAVVIGAVATVAGLVVHEVWRVFPAERLLLSLVLAAIVGAAAWPLRRGLRWRAASAFAVVWLALLMLFVGVLPALATLMLAAAAWPSAIASCPRKCHRATRSRSSPD